MLGPISEPSVRGAHSAFQARGLWFAPARPKLDAKHQLFCAPYAGGGASVYARWQQWLPEVDVWSVELPGRQLRAAEPPVRSLTALAHALADAVQSAAHTDYSLLGCSMGGLIMFEVARLLQSRRARMPRQLFVLAANAPGLRTAGLAHALHELEDADLVHAVAQAFAPIPPALLEDAETRAALLRVLRADIEVVEGYVYRPGPALSCPLVYCYGAHDPSRSEHAARAWSRHTSAAFEVCEIDGDHFFVQTAVDALLTRLSPRLL